MQRHLHLLLVAAILTGTVQVAVPVQANSKIPCGVVGHGAYDPITNHDQAPSGPDNTFMTNTAFLTLANPNAANYSDLAVDGADNCKGNPDDTALYYFRTLTLNGQPYYPTALRAYYWPWNLSPNPDPNPEDAYPPDLRLTSAKASWGCDEKSTRPGPYPSPTAADCALARPSGAGGMVRLSIHIKFPTCWDGVIPSHIAGDIGDTSDNAHVAYPTPSDGPSARCPEGFTRHLPRLVLTIWYGQPQIVADNGSHIALSSGGPSTEEGFFFNSWLPAYLQSMIADCIAPASTATHFATLPECGF